MSNAENVTTGPRADRTESRKTLKMSLLPQGKNGARHWCFTIAKPTADTWERLGRMTGQFEHYAWQEEKAFSGLIHCQGYACFPKKMSFKAVKDAFPAGAHLEMAVKPSAAYKYALKEDTRVEGGHTLSCGCCPEDPTEQLKGNRWEKFREFTKLNDWDACVEAFPDLVKNVGAMRIIYERKLAINRDLAKEVTCFYGETGVGKSLTVSKLLAGKTYFRACNGKWFDGYAYEDIIWIDDMQPKQFTRSFFLQLLDYGPVRAEVKGGTCIILASKIFINSPGYNTTRIQCMKTLETKEVHRFPLI